MVLLSNDWLKLLKRTVCVHEGRIFDLIRVANLQALAHLRVFVHLSTVLAMRAHLCLCHVLFMLQIVSFVDIECQIFLKLCHLSLGSLTGLEVLLSLGLQSAVRLHEIIV